jgi:hypothetical protein
MRLSFLEPVYAEPAPFAAWTPRPELADGQGTLEERLLRQVPVGEWHEAALRLGRELDD